MTGKPGKTPAAWYPVVDYDGGEIQVPSITVESDWKTAQPIGFVWFQKPRYRVKAASARNGIQKTETKT